MHYHLRIDTVIDGKATREYWHTNDFALVARHLAIYWQPIYVTIRKVDRCHKADEFKEINV